MMRDVTAILDIEVPCGEEDVDGQDTRGAQAGDTKYGCPTPW
jgi:hypothetical protein